MTSHAPKALTSPIPGASPFLSSRLDVELIEHAPTGGASKRIADICIAAFAILATFPITLMVAALIRLSMGGPVLYSQPRVGHRGREFRCYKFRTMETNADERLAQLLSQNPIAAAEWAEYRKLRHDPRVSRLGRILRKSSLDELPQFFNVLRGDMSCVGPRPVVAAEIPRYGACAREYLAARPGITGLWQVSGRTSVTYDRRISLDRYYVRRWSMRLDMIILLRTIGAVLKHDETA
jgi:exopolysaccharide production protein ExoY